MIYEKIDEKLLELAKNTDNICTDLGNNQVLLKKMEPINVQFFSCYSCEEYKTKVNEANKKGLHTPKIYDKMRIDENYVLILEDKAKGKSQADWMSLYIDVNYLKDADNILKQYKQLLISYFQEVEIRSNAPQQHYDNYVYNYIHLNKMGLCVDLKIYNIFYDKNFGFTFIDVGNSGDKNFNPVEKRDLIGLMDAAISHFPLIRFGTKREYWYDLESFCWVPKDQISSYLENIKKINKKMISAFQRYQLDYYDKTDYSVNEENIMDDETFYKKVSSILEQSTVFLENVKRKEEDRKIQKEQHAKIIENARKLFTIANQIQQKQGLELLTVFDFCNIYEHLKIINEDISGYQQEILNFPEEKKTYEERINILKTKKKIIEETLKVLQKQKIKKK